MVIRVVSWVGIMTSIMRFFHIVCLSSLKLYYLCGMNIRVRGCHTSLCFLSFWFIPEQLCEPSAEISCFVSRYLCASFWRSRCCYCLCLSKYRRSTERILRCCSSRIVGVLFTIPFHIRKFVGAFGSFQIIRRYSFEASLAPLAFRHSADIDWGEVRCVGWLSYKSKTDNVLDILDQQVPGKERMWGLPGY